MPSSETHSFGEPSSSLPVLRAKSGYQTSYCGQPRQAFSLRRSSVNRKGRGTGSERVALYTCCARVVCRKYSCKSLWGMTTEQNLQQINSEADRLVSVKNYRFDTESEMVLTSSVLKEN